MISPPLANWALKTAKTLSQPGPANKPPATTQPIATVGQPPMKPTPRLGPAPGAPMPPPSYGGFPPKGAAPMPPVNPGAGYPRTDVGIQPVLNERGQMGTPLTMGAQAIANYRRGQGGGP